LSIVIVEPVPGASIDSDRVNVRGTFSGPLDTGITINDRIAYTANGRFALNELPLTPGSNTIDAIVTAIDGRTATTSVTIQASGNPSPLKLVANTTSGFAPLTVTFSYTRASTMAITKLAIDFDGDGRDDYSTRKTPPTSVQNTYTTPGLYQARLSILDASGQTLRSDLSILVEAEANRDDVFTSLWNSMNDALVKQDVSAALGHLNLRAQEQYASIFQELLPDMPAIVASYSQPQRVSVQSDLMEYAVNRTIGGVDRIFFVYLLRDGDGVWRLDSM
jgi:hypothetical protein